MHGPHGVARLRREVVHGRNVVVHGRRGGARLPREGAYGPHGPVHGRRGVVHGRNRVVHERRESARQRPMAEREAPKIGNERTAVRQRLSGVGGAARRTRTPNPQIRSLPLYPLSYGCTVAVRGDGFYGSPRAASMQGCHYSMRPVVGEEAKA